MRGKRGAVLGTLEEIATPDPAPGEVLVRVRYAGVNYKDAISSAGFILANSIDCVAGSEAVGEVVASCYEGVREGDEVIVHGRGLGMIRDGTFNSHVCLPGDWVVPLPSGMNALDAASLGSAGFVAALSLEAMEINGLRPDAGPVAVTGASGGAGGCAVALLASQGYKVTAITRKAETQSKLLRDLGASEVRCSPDEAELADTNLGEEYWAGAVDAVGGPLLAWLLRTSVRRAPIANFGISGGATLNTSLLPLIVRGVRLLGISSDVPTNHRLSIWKRLAGPWQIAGVSKLAHCIKIEELPDVLSCMLRGETTGRTLVTFP
ncbi:MAG TPA: alcohol dehydrogenase catalytic domain-containing protein [Magnetovibrio sp.]